MDSIENSAAKFESRKLFLKLDKVVQPKAFRNTFSLKILRAHNRYSVFLLRRVVSCSTY